MTVCTTRLALLAAFVPVLAGGERLAAEQYKLVARDAIAEIDAGNYDDARRSSESYLREHPGDLESLYVLAVAWAREGDLERALACVREAVASGLPFERFQAGPRDLLRPLTESPGFQDLAKTWGREFLHGPMLGCLTDRGVSFWLRTLHEVPVRIEVRVADTPGPPCGTAAGRTRRENDFTAVLHVQGLDPNTDYEYTVRLDDGPVVHRGRFRTFPEPGRPARFEIGFGGGAGYTPVHERMWDTLAARDLDAFLFLGDNVYIDHPQQPAVQDYCYYRRQSRPEFRRFTARIPIFAIWDDHDFAADDGWGGPGIDEPKWKIPVWQTFRNNWVNPYYGGGESQPGCWFDFSIADVDFLMLDGRYYRPRAKRQGVEVKSPSMLGPAQKKWLLEKLRRSQATFKVLVSPVPWSFGTKPGIGAMDTWEGFADEREEIFSFLERHRIDGVILLSADRHRSDVWKIERDHGYPLYEFESSRLTNLHTHPLMPGAVFGYNQRCSFTSLAFDTTLPDPRVTGKIVNIDNEVVYVFTIRRSELTDRR